MLATQQIDQAIQDFISRLDSPEDFKSALSYYLFPGGKRLRPNIAVAVCEDLKGDVAKCINASVALELLHASSLIHDDLPALDNDDFRRGRPSCHKEFGEARAILAGDALMMLTFSAISDSALSPDHDSSIHKIVASAGFEICVGQVLDMNEIKGAASEIDIVNRRKTAALFEASFLMGGVIGNALKPTIQALSAIGRHFGRGFQLLNDFQDWLPTASGRPNSSDAVNKKVTILTRPREEAQPVVSQIIEDIDLATERLKEVMPSDARIFNLIGPFIAELKKCANDGGWSTSSNGSQIGPR